MKNTFDPKKAGEKLVTLRGTKTRKEVSAELGISESALAMYEAGQRTPRDSIKIRIADFYQVPVCDIFFDTIYT